MRDADSASPARRPRLLRKLGALGLGLTVALSTAELASRWLAPQYLGLHVHPGAKLKDDFVSQERIGLYDERLGWKLKPSARTVNEVVEFSHEIATNARGYRDEDTPFERPEGRRRIVLIGDSFTMGDGVHRGELFADRLEELLDVDVVNLGVNGYGTDQEVLTYEEEGVRYGGDVVLLAFTVPNDVVNNGSAEQYGKKKPYFLPTEDGGLELAGVPVPYRLLGTRPVPVVYEPRFELHDWLDTHSALYALVFHRLATIDSVRERWEASGLLHEQVGVFYPAHLWMMRSRPNKKLTSAWEITRRLLGRWSARVRAEGSVPALMMIPSHLQVDQELWAETMAERDLDPSKHDASASNRRLAGICEEHGIAALDLLPVLREAHASSSVPLYYRKNPHWTAEGHRVAAEALAEFLSADAFWSEAR